MEPMFEAGIAARTGVFAAVLAKSDATAAPQVLEGRHGFFRCWAGVTKNVRVVTENLGETFIITETTIKPFPALRS